MNTDGRNAFGGGFSDLEIARGLYMLTAASNVAPWPSFGSAIETWRKRADQLCGAGKYQEIKATRHAGYQGTNPVYAGGGQMLNLPAYNAAIQGYVLCDSSGMTPSQAVTYLDGLAAARTQTFMASSKKALEDLGGADCAATDGVTAEILYRRGKLLTAQSDYPAAMACYLAAQEREQGTLVYRESCIAIGTMYELGWGVRKDPPVAMEWYRKGGL